MGALSHLRIVEIGSSAATSYCARLFADFGAQATKSNRCKATRFAAPRR
jgi:crotonobetainyl-CoA:carnitine CoA-transferase CaiB-like acyl-CoA transferase